AAARSKLFSPQALLARLDKRLALLIGGPRDLPARQQTLRSAITWSCDLLGAAEQALFARLGVFIDGGTLEAAEAVTDFGFSISDFGLRAGAKITQNPKSEIQNILDGMSSLLDQSLLKQAEGIDGEPRFVMLETIREYALESLEERGETELLRR